MKRAWNERSRRWTTTAICLAALLAVGTAQAFLGVRHGKHRAKPSVPKPLSAQLMSLGYREMCADVLYTRGLALQGGRGETLADIAGVADAIEACDPKYVRVYEWMPAAAEFADEFDGLPSAPQRAYLTSIKFLERGIARMPNEWRILQQAGQIYLVDLKSDNPIEDRGWKERGALLLERAVRQPGAPKKLASLAAHIRTTLGQHERARDNLREMLALATTKEERDKFAQRLAELSATSAESLAYEFEINQVQTEQQWKATMPQVPLADSLLLRRAPTTNLDPATLAAAMAFEPVAPPLPPLYGEGAP